MQEQNLLPNEFVTEHVMVAFLTVCANQYDFVKLTIFCVKFD